jgi:hypothetical protein
VCSDVESGIELCVEVEDCPLGHNRRIQIGKLVGAPDVQRAIEVWELGDGIERKRAGGRGGWEREIRDGEGNTLEQGHHCPSEISPRLD